jgi:hypothetical protein
MSRLTKGGNMAVWYKARTLSWSAKVARPV